MTLEHSARPSNDKPQPAKTGKGKARREKRPPKKITEKYLHNSGLAYLQRFTASTGHFRSVMMRKINRSCAHHTAQSRDECTKMLQTTIEKFQDLGLLNDEAYARGMVTSLRRRGLSSKAIFYKLQQKRLPAHMIESALSDIDEGNSQADMIAALRLSRRKKIGPFKVMEKPEEKELGQLARAGFNYETSRKILSMSLEDAEELLNSHS